MFTKGRNTKVYYNGDNWKTSLVAGRSCFEVMWWRGREGNKDYIKHKRLDLIEAFHHNKSKT